jgi:endonuclease G
VKTRFAAVLFLCCSFVLLSACVKPRLAARRAPFTTLVHREAGLTPDQEKNRDLNCFQGCPALSSNSGYGPTQMIYRKGYVLQHSVIDRIPIWVAEHVTKDQLTGGLARDDRFRPDPLLPVGKRAELKDYKGSGYDRGHQAPAGNQTSDVTLKSETFFLSNMCPQVRVLNQQKWKELETKTRDWAKRFSEAYEITGPIFYDPKEDNPGTANGTVTFKQIGPDLVSVPTHFFKVVIAKDGGKLQAIGFVMENRAYPKDFHVSEAIRSLRWIEERTSLDFMPNLDLAEQERLEAEASPMWP